MKNDASTMPLLPELPDHFRAKIPRSIENPHAKSIALAVDP